MIIANKEVKNIMTLACITEIATIVVAAATVVVAIAARGSAKAANRYADLTHQLILEQRESQLNDKFPCIVVRSRHVVHVSGVTPTTYEWKPRLVNIGRGPAFIEYFETTGLEPHYKNGVHTDEIDKVIGPNVGDPDLEIPFANGTPEVLRRSEVTIVVRYHDIAGRVFTSGIREGNPFYEPAWQH